MKVYTFSTRNRGIGLLAGLLLLGAGTAFLLLGVALLAGIAIVGGVLGTGVMAYRMLRGRPVTTFQPPPSAPRLDPSLEVFADPAPNDDQPRIGPA